MNKLIVLFACLALSLAWACADPSVPDIPSRFESDVDITIPIFGKQSGYLYYEQETNMSRVDQTFFGSKVTTIEDGNQCVSYTLSSMFGQKFCNTSFLDHAMQPYTIPPKPLSSYKGEETVNGVDSEHWKMKVGYGLISIIQDWWVDKAEPEVLVRTVGTVGPFKTEMDFTNFKAKDSFDDDVFSLDGYSCPSPICQKEIDLVLLLDGSGSITDTDWDLMKSFSVELVKYFDVSQVTAQIAVVQYASVTRVEAASSSTQEQLIHAINNMNQLKSGTATGLGLTIAQSVLEANQPRNSPTQVIVLVTDGASTEGVDPIETAKAYKDAGTIIFTVGVGADIKESEVKGIASDPTASHYFKADEFAKLGDICLQIAASTCMADVGGCI